MEVRTGVGARIIEKTMVPGAKVTEVASIHRYGQSPSIGRVRKACTLSSISSTRRLTWLLEIPLMPMALTTSSTERVETPWM